MDGTRDRRAVQGKVGGVLDEWCNGRGFPDRVAPLGKDQQLLTEGLGPHGCLIGTFEQFVIFIGRVGELADKVDIADDGCEQVVEIMGYTACQALQVIRISGPAGPPFPFFFVRIYPVLSRRYAIGRDS